MTASPAVDVAAIEPLERGVEPAVGDPAVEDPAVEDLVYLDHHATTPCDPRVVEAMLPCFHEVFANPASPHAAGQRAEQWVQRARRQVADLLACEPSEIVFTSGATESNNLAITGAAEADPRRRRHLITAVTEHKAVLDVMARLERRGYEVTYLSVAADGRVSPEQLRSALRPDTLMVSLMLANNEIGVLHPIPEIAALCRARGVLVHCDAAQALAHVDCRITTLDVDLLSISAHKAYGPKGIGALYVRRRPRVRLTPRQEGGGQERGRRSGTLNVPGIVGFGTACALVAEEGPRDARHCADLRDLLLQTLRHGAPDLRVHGSLQHRLPNNLNVSFPGVDGQQLLRQLPTLALSSGAACSSPNQGGSYVLKALAAPEDAVAGSLRCGVGRFTSRRDIERASDQILAAVAHCRRRPAPAADVCGAPC